jgi:hypothetical protein
METKMKTITLWTLATILSIASSATFAQNYVTQTSAYGTAQASINGQALGGITAKDLAYQAIARVNPSRPAR